MKEKLLRLYEPDQAEDALFRGVTTNPPLSLDVLNYQKEYWRRFVERVFRIHPHKRAGEIFWQMYKEIVRKGAEMFLPIFEDSGYRQGYISAQLDPRDKDNFDFILEQAEELATLS